MLARRHLVMITALSLLALTTSPQARELAVAVDKLIPVELATVGMVPMTGTPVVLLREPESGNIVPIFIGPAEARAIIMAQRDIEPPRPMTHDLLVSLLAELKGRLNRVIVDELRDNTYHGALEIIINNGSDTLLVDSRPSDALAIAVRTGAAIYVAPSVLDAGKNIPFEGLGEEDVVTALGITVMVAGDDLRQALDLPDEPGVLVSSVEGMAAMAGVQPGALITSVNERTPVSPMTFLELVNATERGEKARVRFWHEGQFQEVELDTEVEATTPRSERRRRI